MLKIFSFKVRKTILIWNESIVYGGLHKDANDRFSTDVDSLIQSDMYTCIELIFHWKYWNATYSIYIF